MLCVLNFKVGLQAQESTKSRRMQALNKNKLVGFKHNINNTLIPLDLLNIFCFPTLNSAFSQLFKKKTVGT